MPRGGDLDRLIERLTVKFNSLELTDKHGPIGITVDAFSAEHDVELSEVIQSLKQQTQGLEKIEHLIKQFDHNDNTDKKIAEEIFQLLDSNIENENVIKIKLGEYLKKKTTSIQLFNEKKEHLKGDEKVLLSILALLEDDQELFDFVMEEKFDINSEVEPLNSLLYYAIQTRNITALKKLLEKGADPNYRTKNQKVNPLISAIVLLKCDEDAVKIVELLAEKTHLNDTFDIDGFGVSALSSVCATPKSFGNSEYQKRIIQLLIEKGANVNLVLDSKYNYTALHKAALGGSRACYIELLKQKADPSIKDANGRTAKQILEDKNLTEDFETDAYRDFHQAIQDQDVQEVAFWINQGLDVNKKGPQDDKFEIQWAIEKGNSKILELLCKAKADLSVKDRKGESLLPLAMRKGKSDLMQVLLNHKADINEPSVNGLSLLQLAIWNNNKEQFDLLINANPKNADNTINWAVQHGKTEWLETLLTRFDVNTKDENGWTPLNWAIWNGNIAAVTTLLNHNPNINTIDNQNWSPLHWAVYYDRPEIVELLVKADVKIDIKDQSGWTPLHWAIWNDKVECFNKLMESKNIEQCINVQDNHGWTPLHWANYYQKDVAIEKLNKLKTGEEVNEAQNISPSKVSQYSKILFPNDVPNADKDCQTEIHKVVNITNSPNFDDVLLGIGDYIKNDGKHLNTLVKFFDGQRGLQRARIYKDFFGKQELNDPLNTIQKQIFLYALLASNDGDTLKKFVIKAIYKNQGLTEKEIQKKLKVLIDSLGRRIRDQIPTEKITTDKIYKSSVDFLNTKIISKILSAVNFKRAPKAEVYDNIKSLFDMNNTMQNADINQG